MSSLQSYRIRPAVSADLPAIVALEAECFSGDRLSRRSLAYHIANPKALLLVAQISSDSGLAAYGLSLTHSARHADRFYSLAVASAYRGQGLAEQLLREGERRSNAPSLYLEVRADNDAAIALYMRLGFHETARRVAYYQDGMDALVMTKQKIA